jgi:hypothetical protein
MSSTPMSGSGGPGDIQERMSRIRIGMDVEDSTGELIGKVGDLRNGDPDAVDIGGRDSATMVGEGFALAMGAHREPNVPPGLVNRLLRAGYIKIDDKRRLRTDHHYYALADDIVSVEADTVRLGKASTELIPPAE